MKVTSLSVKVAYFEGDEEFDPYFLIRQEIDSDDGEQDIVIPAPEMDHFIEGLIAAKDMVYSKNVH